LTEIVLLLATFFAMYMTWRGYCRGALLTIVSWLPPLVALGAFILVIWLQSQSPAGTIVNGFIAAVATYTSGVLAIRVVQLRLAPRLPPRPKDEPRSWHWWSNHIAGAVLGLLCSTTACLGFASLTSTLPFAYTIATQSGFEDEKTEETPYWITKLGETCITLAEVSDSVVLGNVPRLREYSGEMNALVTILNAAPEDLRRVAELHGLGRLEQLPVVKTALEDKRYAELFLRLQDGDITAVSELADSSITRDLLTCPEIRSFTRTLTPSSLARDLEAPGSENKNDVNL